MVSVGANRNPFSYQVKPTPSLKQIMLALLNIHYAYNMERWSAQITLPTHSKNTKPYLFLELSGITKESFKTNSGTLPELVAAKRF